MPTLIDNLNLINSYKSDIKSAIENKGVDMTGVSFGGYAEKIGEIETGGTFVTETLSVSQNGTYYPGQDVDGFSQVDVNVPQDVTGFTIRQVLEASGYESEIYDYSTSFVSSAAMMYTSIKTLDLPDCGSVYRYAFCSCKSLQSVNLPNCTFIGGYAFFSCAELTQISLPVCTKIGELGLFGGSNVFGECSKLSEVYFPKVKEVGEYIFYQCSSLTTVNFPECSKIGGSVFYGCKLLSDVSLPYCLSIDNSVFTGCSALQELSLPVVSRIGNYCFRSCTNLQKLTLCNETYKIPTYQNQFFSNTTFWTNGSIYVASDMYSRWIVATGWSSRSARFVSLNQSGPVLSYDTGTVYGITKYLDNSCLSYLGVSKADVVSISLSNSIILETNFSDFRVLPNLTSLSLPNIVSINNQCFMNCSSLKELYAPECKYIGQNAFQSCNSLSQVNISKCEYVGPNAFQNCRSLSQVNLPVCSYIGNLAFYKYHYNLSLTLGYSGVVQCDGNQPVDYSNTVSIYVPSSLVNEYKTTYPWSTYSSQIFPIPE